MMSFAGAFFEEAASEPAPPHDRYSTALTIPTPLDEDEDSSEWEYEYSNTETETYYVTLDLTTPNVPPRRKAQAQNAGRKKPKWVNPGLGKLTSNSTMANWKPEPPTYKTGNDDDPVEDGGETEKEDNFEDDEQDPASPKGDTTAVPEIESKPRGTEVQILDLHTRNPLVSFDGHIYSCQWAENIGTEMLFTAHDDRDLIPHLRSLDGGVDLLAASSARIVSKYVKLEHRDKPFSRRRPRPKGKQRADESIITVHAKALPERKDQARFLSKLIALKKRRHESDKVTIFTRKRMTWQKWKNEIDTTRDKERKALQRIIKRGPPNSENVYDAVERLEDMNFSDEERRRLMGEAGVGLDGKDNPLPRGKRRAGVKRRKPPGRTPGKKPNWANRTRVDLGGLVGEGEISPRKKPGRKPGTKNKRVEDSDGDEDDEMIDFDDEDEDDEVEDADEEQAQVIEEDMDAEGEEDDTHLWQ